MKKLSGLLNEKEIRYVFMECDSKTLYGTDYSILVHPDDRKEFWGEMIAKEYSLRQHQEGKENGFRYLYSMFPAECWVKDNITYTVFYQLGCYGLQEMSYIPLDKLVNKSIWDNRYLEDGIYHMDRQEKLIYAMVQGVFHYNKFPEHLRKIVEENKDCFAKEDFQQKLRLVFFKFSSKIQSMLEMKKYDEIFHNYISFSEY